MSSRVIAICDLCGAEQVIKADADGCDWDHELALEGWWTRTDAIRDICPKHPRPVTA